MLPLTCFLFFFFNDTATTEISTLSLHDALPISWRMGARQRHMGHRQPHHGGSRDFRWGEISRTAVVRLSMPHVDRKSTRLNSSHQIISYAVFCLKKKRIAPDKSG